MPWHVHLGDFATSLHSMARTAEFLCMQAGQLCTFSNGSLCVQVFQVRDKRSRKIFAMKVMRKDRILEREHSTYVRAERDILTSVVHPYIVRMRFSFQVIHPLRSLGMTFS